MQENLFFSREAMTYRGPLLESSMLTKLVAYMLGNNVKTEIFFVILMIQD